MAAQRDGDVGLPGIFAGLSCFQYTPGIEFLAASHVLCPVSHFPRNSRYNNVRRSIEERRRKQVILLLSLVVLLTTLVAAVWRQSDVAPPAPLGSTEATPTLNTTIPPSPTIAADTSAVDMVEPAVGGTAPTETPSAVVPSFTHVLFDPQRFSYEPDFYEPQIQAFLDAQPGPLKATRFQIGNRSHSFAEVLVNLGNLYSLNPKIVLALIEQQSQLLSTAHPTPEQMSWALGFQGESGARQGLFAQLRWATITLRHGVRDYATLSPGALPDLVFADDTRQPPAPGLSLTQYALMRVLAPTTTPDELDATLNLFLKTYMRLFEDPRLPPTDWPPLAEPFLTSPMEKQARVTSFFDHDLPFLQQNGSLVSFWGQRETALSYDGHTGWDYGMRPPDVVLSAAEGTVVFAGHSEDGCLTPAGGVIIDHANGYRTLYWHLSSILVETNQVIERGMPIGVAGATGCAFGPHLHFQVQYLGRDVDPYGWCGSKPDPWADNPAGQVSVWLWADMPSPCAPPPAHMIIVDDTDPGFAASGEWEYITPGYGGSARFARSIMTSEHHTPWQSRPLITPAVAVWQPELPQAGYYRVLAYIPYVLNGLDESRQARYRVHHRDGEAEVIVNGETYANGWVDLGTYAFEPEQPALVSVSTLAGDHGRGIWADAMAWVPVGEQEH